jgi:hypothetical protein
MEHPKTQQAFNDFLDAMRDEWPDGEPLTLDQQVKVLTKLAEIAVIMNIEILGAKIEE